MTNTDKMQKASPKPAPQLAEYPHRVAEIVRFADLDAQAHVNQATYATYFESGRVGMFRDPTLGVGVPGITFVLVRQEIDYLKELHWPANIVVGSAILEFGRSSFKVAQAVFRDGVCTATGRSTMVCIDKTTRKAVALPEPALARLREWKLA